MGVRRKPYCLLPELNHCYRRVSMSLHRNAPLRPLWMLTTALFLLAWASHFVRLHIAQEREDAWRTWGPSPYLVSGSRINPLPYLREIGSPTISRPPHKVLLYYTSDKCGYSRANLPHIEHLVGQLPVIEGNEIWLVSARYSRWHATDYHSSSNPAPGSSFIYSPRARRLCTRNWSRRNARQHW